MVSSALLDRFRWPDHLPNGGSFRPPSFDRFRHLTNWTREPKPPWTCVDVVFDVVWIFISSNYLKADVEDFRAVCVPNTTGWYIYITIWIGFVLWSKKKFGNHKTRRMIAIQQHKTHKTPKFAEKVMRYVTYIHRGGVCWGWLDAKKKKKADWGRGGKYPPSPQRSRITTRRRHEQSKMSGIKPGLDYCK